MTLYVCKWLHIAAAALRDARNRSGARGRNRADGGGDQRIARTCLRGWLIADGGRKKAGAPRALPRDFFGAGAARAMLLGDIFFPRRSGMACGLRFIGRD